MLSIFQNFVARITSKKQKSELQSLNRYQNAGKAETGEKKLKTRVKKLDKNKIPVLNKNTDFSEYFKDKEDRLPDSSVKSKKKRKKKKEKKSTGQKPGPLTKNKIKIFKKDTDFSEYFPEEFIEETYDKPEKYPNKVLKAKNRKPKTKKKSFPVNKNGVPVLSNEEDLFKYFMDNEDANHPDSLPSKENIDKKENIKKVPEENFEEMLEKSLEGKNTAMLLQEKHEKVKINKPLTKKEIIKTYPLHQEELDLHGFTAAQALEKNENFIRKAWCKGKRTLLVIVGKGIHTRGKAVLPDVIENQILEFKRKNIVLTYQWDKSIKRKSGALIVYLTDKEIKS